MIETSDVIKRLIVIICQLNKVCPVSKAGIRLSISCSAAGIKAAKKKTEFKIGSDALEKGVMLMAC